MAKKKKTEEEVEATIGSKEVAEHLGIDPKKMRAIIRDNGVFGDQRNTRYSFTGLDDPRIEQIRAIIEAKAAKRATEEDEDGGKKKPSKKGRSKSKRSNPKRKLKKGRAKEVEEEEEEEEE